MKLVFLFILVILIISIYTYNLKKSVHIQEKFDANIDNIYCINLESNKERFYLLDSMAKNAKLSLTRFEAIDTRGDLYLQYKNIIHPVALEDMHQTLWRNKRIHEHGLTPGAIGCYLSHMSLYKESLNRDDKMIIVFEDDTQIPKNFKEGLLEKMKNLPENWDMFLLGWIPMGKENKLITQDLYHVHRFILMHAYVITDVGMRKMLNLCMPVIKKQVDHVVSDFSHTIHIYGTNPRGWIKQGSPSKNDAYRTNIQIPLLKREVENFTSQSYDKTKNTFGVILQNTYKSLPLRLSRLCSYEHKIYIINGKKYKKRLESTINILKKLNFTNIYVWNASFPDSKEIDNDKPYTCGLKIGALGCAMSHRRLWEHIAKIKNSQWVIIVEDDIQLPDIPINETKQIITNTLEDKDDHDIIYFGHCWGKLCTHAYAIKPHSAKILLENTSDCSRKKPLPIDVQMSRVIKTKNLLSFYIEEYPRKNTSWSEGIIHQKKGDSIIQSHN